MPRDPNCSGGRTICSVGRRTLPRVPAVYLMRRGIMYNDSLFNAFARSYEARSETDMSMAEYLESCRGDPMRYANAAERLLAAIGEPQMIDTARDPRLGRVDHLRLDRKSTRLNSSHANISYAV